MGDGGYSNIYEVYGEDTNLLALKVCQKFYSSWHFLRERIWRMSSQFRW